MEWFYLALLSTALFPIGNILDKFLLSKGRFLKFPSEYVALFILLQSLIAASIALLFKIQYVFPQSLIAIGVGLLQLVLFHLYARGVAKGEVTRAVSLLFTSPLLVLILAFVFLGETFGLAKYIGIVLLVLSAIIISYTKEGGRMKL